MKRLVSLLLCASVFNLSAVPLRWTVETSRAQPAAFEAYQGETLELEARLQTYGKPLEAPSSYALYWQTNGMGSTYWSTNVSNVSNLSNPSNLLRATWRPEYDVGARAYTCFIGQPGTIYHAAFQLRLRPSPGAVPNELPLPQKIIDFATVTVLNPPWSDGSFDYNDLTNLPRIGGVELRGSMTAAQLGLVARHAFEQLDDNPSVDEIAAKIREIIDAFNGDAE